MTIEQRTFSSLAPSERFAQFVGEVTGIAGNIVGTMEAYVVGKIDEATIDSSLAKVVEKVKENADNIAKALFAVGCFYNFYTSPALFLVGVGLGSLASAAPFPVQINSLREGELLRLTSDDGYAAPKVMFSLAALNYYLGKTLLDDMVIGIFSGLIAGNSFFHMAKTSPAGKMITWLGNLATGYTEIALTKLPFTNIYKPPTTNEGTPV